MIFKYLEINCATPFCFPSNLSLLPCYWFPFFQSYSFFQYNFLLFLSSFLPLFLSFPPFHSSHRWADQSKCRSAGTSCPRLLRRVQWRYKLRPCCGHKPRLPNLHLSPQPPFLPRLQWVTQRKRNTVTVTTKWSNHCVHENIATSLRNYVNIQKLHVMAVKLLLLHAYSYSTNKSNVYVHAVLHMLTWSFGNARAPSLDFTETVMKMTAFLPPNLKLLPVSLTIPH